MAHLEFLLPLFLSANAALVSNTTTSVGWTKEPDTRGTAGILFSCLVALGLCIWMAVHLNVERIESSETRITFVTRVAGKCTWAIAALLAPEFVLSIALHQFLVAREYRSIVNKRENGGKGEKSWWNSIRRLTNGSGARRARAFAHEGGSGDGEAHPHVAEASLRNITLKTSFYALMGGFALKTTPTTALTITLDMLVKRGTMQKIRQYPITAIDDKSKADLLAKGVACFQGSWMLLQCLGRQLDALPVTLLELNTVVHVVNAIIMYLLWLEKPVDVGEPSSIDQVYGDAEQKESFVGSHVLEESLETVIQHLLPRVGGAADPLDIDTIKVAKELEYIAQQCKRACIHRLDPRLTLFSTALEAGIVLGEECEKTCRAIFKGALEEGKEAIYDFTNHGTALENCRDQVFDAYAGALQKAFHPEGDDTDGEANDGEGDSEANQDVAYKDRAALLKTIRKAISLVVRGAFREAFQNAERVTRGPVQNAVLRAAQSHNIGAREARQTAFRGAFFVALPRELERALIRELWPKLQGIFRQHFGRGTTPAVLKIACMVAAPIPGTYGEGNPMPLGRPALFHIISGALSSAPGETGLDNVYKAVFEHLRGLLYKIGKDCRKNPEAPFGASEAAFRAAFHLNPMVAQDPDQEREKKAWTLRSMFNGDLITNQIISFPDLPNDSSEGPTEFGKHWQKAHWKTLWVFSVFASALYGGLHTFKWYSDFPTEIERLLWRISSCVGAAGIFPITGLGLGYSKLPVPGSQRAWKFFGFVTGLFFVAARSYIIVESFISLRRLPQKAYETVSWADAIPHV